MKPSRLLLGLLLLTGCADEADDPTFHDAVEQSLDLVPVAVAAPPTYKGAKGDQPGCPQTYSTYGFWPATPGKHPLLLYFVGTGDPFVPAPQGDKQWAGYAVLQAAAKNGYAAFIVGYDNDLPLTPDIPKSASRLTLNKVACTFNPKSADSAVTKLCGFKENGHEVKCGTAADNGIVTWGHSQGAAVAGVAANYDARVRAAWLTGFGEPFFSRPWVLSLSLPTSHARLVNGSADGNNDLTSANHPPTLNEMTGRTCSAKGPCFTGPGGSGWYIVQKSDTQQNDDTHCWFYKPGCTGSQSLEPNWASASSTKPFSIANTFSWLANGTPLAPYTDSAHVVDFKGFENYALTLPWSSWELDGEEYPAGLVRWIKGSWGNSFYVYKGTPNYFTLGDGGGNKTATFQLYDPAGRSFDALTVNNTGASTQLTIVAKNAAGAQVGATKVLTIPSGTSTQTLGYAKGIASFTLSDTVGNALRFTSFKFGGSAPLP